MNQNLTNLFAKYQTNLAFASRPRIASVHDLGLMDETLLNWRSSTKTAKMFYC